MKKECLSVEKDGFYGTYYENPKGSDCTVISLHGGAWVYGDKDRYRYYCVSLVRYGFAVVNFSYRLALKFKYPAPLGRKAGRTWCSCGVSLLWRSGTE